VTSSLRQWGEKQAYFSSSADAQGFEEELARLVYEQRASFNSPVWFNVGLHEAYGIRGSGRAFACEGLQGEVVEVDGAYVRPQASACFIQSLQDDLQSIFELLAHEARLFKYGSGTGTNFSVLRSSSELLSSGGTSSGLMSFLEVFDRAAGATKSGGTTRRAAKMVCLDVDHPEIFEFVRWKVREEEKARALMSAGFSGGMDGEAYRSVSGQNSNNSVRVTDAFLQAVERDEMWSLRARATGEELRRVRARELWREIAHAAWSCADPGVQFDDVIQQWHTCSATGPIRASNPCSEFMFLDDSACNLASLNLVKFLDEEASAPRFRSEEFVHAVRVLVVAQEILVGMAGYPTRAIAENSRDYRPIGLGYANLGGVLMRMGIPYDSDEGRQWAAEVTALMGGEAYRVSAELAATVGAFPGWKPNREAMLGVIRQHIQAAKSLAASTGRTAVATEALAAWQAAEQIGSQHGFRNSQVTVLAPTGTIALMMDCDTTGIEPEYALVKQKRLAGGGELHMVNQSVKSALARSGVAPMQIEAMVQRLEQGESPQKLFAEGLLPKLAVRVLACASEISAEGHVRMMAAVQPYLSGAISKTVNLPASASVEDVAEVFLLGRGLGLKALAIYRDNSKGVQVLTHAFGASAFERRSVTSKNEALGLAADLTTKARDVLTPQCGECGGETLTAGSCWVCSRCGHSVACS
jgi:ribonucleoside-diphosphate reductase alpha chain